MTTPPLPDETVTTRPFPWRTSDGSPGAATLFEPAAGQPAPRALLLCLPAMGVRAARYAHLATALAGRGLVVCTADQRGIGESPVRPGRGVDFGYGRLVSDFAALGRRLRAEHPGRPLHLLGHSLGGHLGVLLAGLHPALVDGLALVAAGTPYFRNWDLPLNARILVLAQVASASATLLGYFPGRRFGFGGTQPRRLIQEWARLSRTGRFVIGADELDPAVQVQPRGPARNGPRFDVEAALALAPACLPVTTISLEGDWMATQRGRDHLVSKLPGAHVTRLHLGPADTDPRGLEHLAWLAHPGTILDRLVEATSQEPTAQEPTPCC